MASFFVIGYLTPEHSLPLLSFLVGVVGIFLALSKSCFSFSWQCVRRLISRAKVQTPAVPTAGRNPEGKHT